ncbi:MAG: heat-inducible transcriptional repressor HrcA [Alphaproteobacteria bacterium]|nr:heat-inducible transcriptional repressor HrcA [Alphaproteobacteria bacterium]
MISELNDRSRTVFRLIVDAYLNGGEPVGSRTLSRGSGLNLSPATIRNVMADLEEAGLLYAPHTSAGRLPTEQGLRLYVDGLMQSGRLSTEERTRIEAACAAAGRGVEDILDTSTRLLSGLASCASLVIAPKMSGTIRHVQFVPLRPGQILAVLVFDSGMVENRVLDVQGEIPEGALVSAGNYLTARMAGKTITQAQHDIEVEMREQRSQLDTITQRLVQQGLALPGIQGTQGRLIIRGQSHLLNDLKALEDLERARALLSVLEQQQTMLQLLQHVDSADGVQIFIGAENKIFGQSGWSMIISPYKDATERVIGAIGVIGPTRLDYDRIVPMVDYTSRVISRLLETD